MFSFKLDNFLKFFRKSDFFEIGQNCDLISVFHDFGVYLLRGHTLFTLIFLSASIFVFFITFICHWRVRLQHIFLSTSGKRFVLKLNFLIYFNKFF